MLFSDSKIESTLSRSGSLNIVVQNSTALVAPADRLIPLIRCWYSDTPSTLHSSFLVVALLSLKTTEP